MATPDRKRKQSVSVAITAPDGKLLVVQRPHDDEDLPNAWGLPAASLRQGESWQDAALRAGREKLGVELKDLRELNHGSLERNSYTLEMKLFGASIMSEPRLRSDVAGVTHYPAWRWGDRSDLESAASAGSLCCQLYLAT